MVEGVFVSLVYNKNNISLAKKLRKNATPEENHLWYDFLSSYEVRFQRQKAIDNFIVDFSLALSFGYAATSPEGRGFLLAPL